MKTLKITLLLITVAISTFGMAQKGQKEGFINSNELMIAMPERDSVQKNLQNYANQFKVQLEAMQKEYQAKITDFQNKQDVMTDLIKETKIKEITDLEKRIGEFQQTAEADLQKKEQELLQPIVDKAKNAIIEVAKENGYTKVTDTSFGVVIYHNEDFDIMDLVKKKLGIQ